MDCYLMLPGEGLAPGFCNLYIRMILFTKQQIAEIALRPQPVGGAAKKVVIKYFCGLKNYKFIKEMRKSTGLNICTFAENLYFIRYEKH